LLNQPLNLRTRTKEEIHNALTLAAPFLARIYAILRQSSMKLNCLNSKKGENFQNWLDDKREGQEKVRELNKYKECLQYSSNNMIRNVYYEFSKLY